METTALSVGKSVLSGALSYAKSALAEEVALQLGVRRDQLFITNELEMMQAFLMAAHDEGVENMVVKVWVKQVRDVAYDVEDGLQEFAVRLRKQSWWRIRRTLVDRRRVAKLMKELRANVEDVSQRNMRYHLIKGSSSKPATIGDQLTITGETMSGTEEARRQWDKAKMDLVRLINKKDNNLRVIAVSGTRAGELGEMSIIKRAYEDPKISKNFECRAWITGLMCPFNLTEFLLSIIEQFHLNFLQVNREKEEPTLEVQVLRKMGMMKEDDLVDEFKRFVSEKSYLIVLSDIHTIEEWGHIKPCFQNNKNGSRIIVSAQKVRVASLCVGPKDAAPEHQELFMNENIYAFYEKGAQDGSDSMEVGTSSNAHAARSNASSNRKMLSRTETILAAFKETHLIGREKEKAEIIELITTEDSQHEVICLWGMGGRGKTTLVRDVYQDEKLSGKFVKRACATIMRPFNVNELLQNLATQFGCKNVTEMQRELSGNTYLIILDDLSSNAEWDTIIPNFPATETFSRIVVTTRVKDIAIHCSKKHENIYELQCLEGGYALDLFIDKVFGKTTNMDEDRRDACTMLFCSLLPAVAMRQAKFGVLVPRGTRRLKALRTLGVVNIARCGKSIQREIKGLTGLRKLAVTGVNKENGEELLESIVGLSHLESLSIRSEGEPGLSGCLDGDFSFPENLQKLKLLGNLVKLPEWIQGLNNLVKLEMRSSRISEHDAVQVLGNLPNLASLLLSRESFEGEDVHLNFCPGMFPSLVVLVMVVDDNLKSVKFEGGATPRLELLKLYPAYVNTSTLFGLPSLSALKELVLENHYFHPERDYAAEYEYLRAELALNPNRPVLTII
ncbi:unnamed protein product [Alopecurus aequalis]